MPAETKRDSSWPSRLAAYVVQLQEKGETEI